MSELISSRTILVSSLVDEQLRLWRELLSSQGYKLVLPAAETNLVKILDETEANHLPDLLLIDIRLKTPGTKILQSSSISRWCRENHPKLKVILTNSKEDEIATLESRWAIKQGAIALLPRLTPDNLIISVRRIAEVLGCQVLEEALHNVVSFLSPSLSESDNPRVIPSETALQPAQFYFDRAVDFNQAGNLDEAKEELGIALRINLDYVEAYILRGDVHIGLNQFQRALDDYNQALRINPQNAEVWWRRGTMYFKLGETQAAIAEFNQGIKLNPKFANLYNSRGLARFHSGDELGALKDYDQAIKLNSTFAEAYCHRGILRYGSRNANAALKDYDQAIKHNPKYTDAYYNRGNVRSDAGDWKKAIADYTDAIRYNPNFALAFGNRGIAYYQVGNVAEAITDTETAANIFREQGDTKSYKRAIETIKQMQ